MKYRRIRSLTGLLALYLSLSLLLSACGSGGGQSSTSEDPYTPLFRFRIAEGTAGETLLFCLPASEGFFYLHPGEESGFVGGFVSPKRSVSAEAILNSTSPLGFATLRETGRDTASLLSGAGLSQILLKEKGETLPYPDLEGVRFENAVFFDDLSIVAETDDLLLLLPVDFAETYVLAQKALLSDFARLLCVTGGKSRLWYATADESGAYTGIAFFEYGKNTPLGQKKFSFDSVTLIGDHGLLFTRKGENGETEYRYLDPESGFERVLSVKGDFTGAVCDLAGDRLVLCRSEEKSGEILLLDFKTGEKKGTHTIAYGNPAPSLALSLDGKTLLFAVGMGSDAILATLDLDHYFSPINSKKM